MSGADSTPGSGIRRMDPEVTSHLIQKKPTVHPLIFSLAEFDFQFAPPDHLTEIYGAVFRAISPEYPNAPKNLARFLPREHGKSEAGAVVIPTWAAVADPNIRVLLMSETENQAKSKLREIRTKINEIGPKYGRVIVEDNKTELTLGRAANWDVPTVKAAGFQTGVTGGHFDLIIFDDLISFDSQRTEARRSKAWQKFQDYLNLGSEGQTTKLTIGTRKHPDDLYNNLIEGPAWDVVVKSAISDWSIVENNEFDVVTDTGSRYNAADIKYINTQKETIVRTIPYRDVPVLWPERWPLDQLLMDVITGYGSERGTAVWKREMQNDASALVGSVLSEDMLVWRDALPKPQRDLTWVAGLDPAVEQDPEKAATGDTDYWALSIFAHDKVDNVSYLTDLYRRRGMTMNQGLQWVAQKLNANKWVRKCLVESNQAQRWFVQSGKEKGIPLRQSSSSGKKEDRIMSMSSRFENGNVQIVARDGEAEKWESFASEWAAFPTGDHDDRLDACEIGLRAMRGGGKQAGTWGSA